MTHCNTYNSDVRNSWDVSGSFRDQIDLFDLNYFPDNKFLSVCDNLVLLDIKSDPAFIYRERQLSSNNSSTILQCVTPTVTVQTDNAQFGAANCVLANPCPDPPNCADLTTQYTGSGKDLRDRNQLLYAYAGWDWRSASDSSYYPAVQKGVDLLTVRNQQGDKRILAATQTALGNYSAAQTWRQQVSGSDAESQDFIQLYTMLINAGLAGRDLYHLTALDFAAVSGQLTHTTAGSEQVRVLDHILNRYYHPLRAETSAGGRAGDQPQGAKEAPAALIVYPNPFNDLVQFSAPIGALLTTLRITDISGKTVFEWKSMVGEAIVSWQTKVLTDGVFLYQGRLSNGERVYGKLLQLKTR